MQQFICYIFLLNIFSVVVSYHDMRARARALFKNRRVDDDVVDLVERRTSYELSEGVTINTLSVEVDHEENKAGNWSFRYMVNGAFKTKESPIIIMVGGNEPLVKEFATMGPIYEAARDNEAILIVTEHRYYGESTGTHNDLKYLTSKNAIEDLRALIANYKKKPEHKTAKVILVGGGYGGNLAVWCKVLYPEEVDFVVASSAPLMAVVDFKEYLQQVSDAYTHHAVKECNDLLRKVFLKYLFWIQTKDISKLWKYALVCQDVDMTKSQNQQLLFLSELSLFMDSAENGLRQIHNSCDLYLNLHRGIDEIYGNERRLETDTVRPFFKTFIFFADFRRQCFDYDFERFIARINQEQHKNLKHWLYQCCMEFGYFPTTSAFTGPFDEDVSISLYYDICSKLFGKNIEKKISGFIEETNKRYGGKKPNVSNVLFTNGSLDPWRALGVTEVAGNETYMVHIIETEGHCSDLIPTAEGDSEFVFRARELIKQKIREVLQKKRRKLYIDS